ncbi:uncharacterized protein LY79DRAFT_584600 [Colletotrichum navitas]|uniref:Uncharacterized protein n=1 Tax=Colletotrichum navitas TaxID=681940 RepID=A0AAD8PLK1_9PEZI|nr:uncharacterized protein LY79DRAFT_584600 [Colletotrichum navitas]KAK1569650.1 hypothetical protein LY79DRAFT_584600 [Colletotrichum navitas]
MSTAFRRDEFTNDDDFFIHINEHRLQDTLDANDRNDFIQWLAAYTADEASVSSFAEGQSTQHASVSGSDGFSDMSHMISFPTNFRLLPRPLVTKKFSQHRPQYEDWMRRTQDALDHDMATRSRNAPTSFQMPGAYMASAPASPSSHVPQPAPQTPRSPASRPQGSHHRSPHTYPQGLLPSAIHRRELQTSIDEDAARLQDLNRQYKAAASKAMDLHGEMRHVSIRLKTRLLQLTLSEGSTDDRPNMIPEEEEDEGGKETGGAQDREQNQEQERFPGAGYNSVARSAREHSLDAEGADRLFVQLSAYTFKTARSGEQYVCQSLPQLRLYQTTSNNLQIFRSASPCLNCAFTKPLQTTYKSSGLPVLASTAPLPNHFKQPTNLQVCQSLPQLRLYQTTLNNLQIFRSASPCLNCAFTKPPQTPRSTGPP